MSKQIIDSTEVLLLTFNDIYEFGPSSDHIGGLAELETLIKHEKKKCKNVLTTFNGDLLVVETLAPKYKGSHIIEVLNQMSTCVGNHDFDFGADVLSERILESKFKFINSNIIDKRTDQLLKGTLKSKILTFDNIKFGIFALCTEETPLISYCGENIQFLNIFETADKKVHELKENGADVIIALTHLSLKEDIELSKKVPEINIILGGHDHLSFTQISGETLIMKAGNDAHYLGSIQLKVNRINTKFNKQYIQILPSWNMILNMGNEPDPNVKKVIDKYKKELPDDLDEEVAYCEPSLDTRTEKIRSQETIFGNMVADAIRDNFEVDLVLMNGGGIRGDKKYPPGHIITKRDLATELPFTNPCYEIEILGSDLLNVFEECLQKADRRHGSFPHYSSGVSLSYDISQTPGKRLIKVTLDGKEIDTKRFYRFVTTKYNLSGGDGLISCTKGNPIDNPKNGTIVRDSCYTYLKKMKIVSPKIENRVVCVNLKI